ncbi:hypothetical protein pb186bvf_014271 [Paramecium bursaria]
MNSTQDLLSALIQIKNDYIHKTKFNQNPSQDFDDLKKLYDVGIKIKQKDSQMFLDNNL